MITKPGPAPFLVFFIMLLFQADAFSQEARNESYSTQATDPDARPDAHKMGPKKKRNLFIIKSNSSGTLYGNRCFREASHHFGFEYLVVPEKVPPNTSKLKKNMHNLGVNFLLLFRNGPFWKMRMKKNFEKCKYGYGDFVG